MPSKVSKPKLPPTLIIGLGGTGCEIVSRVDKLSNSEQRKYMRFVYFDTDANELRIRQQESPYIFTVQTSRRLTVGQALRNDTEACENSFPINLQLLNKPLTEGAGQIRAISKLAFDACLREGRIAPLHDAINELQKLNGDSLEQSMRVVIVSTLVGGTGSGILLPVSMYLRNYLENACQKKPIIRGFCVLPDVFFHNANKTETEKNNLRANAYATLRELDAFMLKADGADSSEFSHKFWLKMPTPGTIGEYDDYSVSPMDFCFLFDGQNMDGDGLENLELYKQHAADCIYASSVSMLNKRLNSSEDNTILQRCAENGRNRYCGVGTSKVIYPFETVRDYIAMKWMDQSMTDDWLRYDKAYETKMIQQQHSRAKGVMLPPIEKRKFYRDSVDSDMAESNYFALSLYEECHNKDKQGISFTSSRWQSYYEKLKVFIDNKVADDIGYDDGLSTKIEDDLVFMASCASENRVTDFGPAYYSVASKLRSFFSLTKRHSEDIAGIIADSVFSPNNFDVSNEHHIEYWLTQNSVPLHPNSIRYFLYNLEALLKKEKHRLDSPADDNETQNLMDAEDELEGMSFSDLEKAVRTFFEAKSYSVETGKDTIKPATIDEYVSGIRSKFGNKNDCIDKMSQVRNALNDQLENIRNYYKLYLRITIIDRALAYIDQLSSNYEYFFQQLESEIKRIPRRIERIEESFENNTGNPIIYACASKTCLKGLAERCPNVVDSISLTDEFREELFKSLFETLRIDNPEKERAVIDDLVSNKILDFWRNEVLIQYSKKVDMDIIDALRTQAEIEESKFDSDEQLYYIEGIADQAAKLAAPFIDRPIGHEPHIIDAYALNGEVSQSDDMLKNSIIRSVFPGHERDPLMSKYQILFMKALYNLKICDLPKFAPADSNEVDPHAEGDYYKAYWKRIDGIIPDSRRTRILTPHLDKRWHYIGVMPDLSDISEERCTAQAHEAFFISVLYHWVKYDRDQYRFLDRNGDFINDTIVVEDGRCNKLSEIYQAMLMSRPLVLNMLERYKEETAREQSNALGNRDFRSTKLYNEIKNAHVVAYDHIPNISIFELPLLCKVCSGNSAYNEEEYVVMLQNMLDFIEKYLHKFYGDPYVRDPYFVEWLEEQALLMLDNLGKHYDTAEHAIIAKPFEEILVNRTVNIIISRIRQYEFCPVAKKCAASIEGKWNELTAK